MENDSNKMERRSFIQRLSLAFTALFVAPKGSFGSRLQSNNSNTNSIMQAILSIKPLGFQWETADPFLFCVHHEDYFPNGNDVMGPDPQHFKGRHMGDDFIIKDGFRMYHGKTVPGFPGHPHRGFETITIVRKGIVDHSDSLGAAGRYGDGDVQWMTAGKGVQHSEMFPLLSKDKENPMELFQIWLNLPKQNKMVEPHFKMLWRESIPNYNFKDVQNRSIKIEVIAGELMDMKAAPPPPDSWAANPDNELAIWNIEMEAGANWILPKASKGINRTLYFYEGKSLNVNNTVVDSYSAISVFSEADITLNAGDVQCRILVLQGKPIGEQVMQYGPFVMNTKEEINQAFEDYHQTQFGGWPWPKYDNVHPRDKPRFAKHADGFEEVKES